MSGLNVDYKITRLIKEIQEEIFKENNIEVSSDDILKCINNQYRCLVNGMANGDTIVLKFFGTFVATQKRVDVLNKKYEKQGRKKGLEDFGFKRISFNKKDEIVNEGVFEPSSIKEVRDNGKRYI